MSGAETNVHATIDDAIWNYKYKDANCTVMTL